MDAITSGKQQFIVTVMAIGRLVTEQIMAHSSDEAKELFLMQYEHIEPSSITITRSCDDAQIEHLVRMLLVA